MHEAEALVPLPDPVPDEPPEPDVPPDPEVLPEPEVLPDPDVLPEPEVLPVPDVLPAPELEVPDVGAVVPLLSLPPHPARHRAALTNDTRTPVCCMFFIFKYP